MWKIQLSKVCIWKHAAFKIVLANSLYCDCFFLSKCFFVFRYDIGEHISTATVSLSEMLLLHSNDFETCL